MPCLTKYDFWCEAEASGGTIERIPFDPRRVDPIDIARRDYPQELPTHGTAYKVLLTHHVVSGNAEQNHLILQHQAKQHRLLSTYLVFAKDIF